jgi:hypothetical protein
MHKTDHVLISARNVKVTDRLANLYAHLLENRYIESIVGFNVNFLNIFSREALKLIKKGDVLWEKMVPAPVADAIKRRGLFGHAEAMSTWANPSASFGGFAPTRLTPRGDS